MNHLPPCCASCPELDAQERACRLISQPSVEARHRLLTMPCDVPRLLRQRFRGHGEEVGQRAMLAWLDPQRNEADLRRSYETAPRDARLWLTSWPYRALAREAIAQKLADTEPLTPKESPPTSPEPPSDPVVFARTAASLARLAMIDPAGYAMTIDSLRGAFHATAWRASLGATDVAINDRRALSLYRYAVLFFDVLGEVEPKPSAAALRARRFVAGDPSDAAALNSTRDELNDKQLPISDWRTHYKAGVLASLEILKHESALGVVAVSGVESVFRRVLRIDDKPSSEAISDDAMLARFEAHSASAGIANSDAHLAPDLIASLASGDLQGPDIAAASRHFLCCRDRRCCAFLRWEVGGKEAVRRDLSGPMSEPPPGMTVTFTQGPSSQHLVDCRDVLWDAFTQMARAEGRSIDDLVNDAMARYRVIREYAAPPAPKPPSRLGRTSGLPPRPSSRPPPSRISVPPPPTRASRSSTPPDSDEELTPPEGAVRRASKPPEPPAETVPFQEPGSRVGPPLAPRPSAVEAPRLVDPLSLQGPPPIPEWVKEPVTTRAPELDPSEAAPRVAMNGAPGSEAPRPIPRPLDSSRTLPGVAATPTTQLPRVLAPEELRPQGVPAFVTPPVGTPAIANPLSGSERAEAPPRSVVPLHQGQHPRTVELAPGLLPPPVDPAPAQSLKPSAQDPNVIDERLEALPSRSRQFDEAEDTSPKMNLSPLNPPLFVEYAGKRGHVNQPRYVIGREAATCNLVLNDSNVSRQHAVVEWHNGAYFLIDLGSTNGVGCGGHRINRKQIVEGDRFDISGHSITFTFRL